MSLSVLSNLSSSVILWDQNKIQAVIIYKCIVNSSVYPKYQLN